MNLTLSLDFSSTEVHLYVSLEQFARDDQREPAVLLYPFDRRGSCRPTETTKQLGLAIPAWPFGTEMIRRRLRETKISWANKPFFLGTREDTPENAPAPASDWLN